MRAKVQHEWTREVNHRWRGDGDDCGGGGKATSAYIDTRLLSAVTFTRATPRPSLAFPARKTGSKVGKHECATSCLCNAAALSAYSYSVVAWRAVAARQAAPYNLSLLTYHIYTSYTPTTSTNNHSTRLQRKSRRLIETLRLLALTLKWVIGLRLVKI